MADDLIVSGPSVGGTLVLFAVERELAPFARLVPDYQIDSAGCYSSPGGNLKFALTGVGKTEARKRLQRFLDADCRPERVVAAGFAGALVEKFRVGDVIVPAEIVDDAGRRWLTTWPQQRCGRLLTSLRMIGEPAEKRDKGKQHAADIVDMESAWIAETCAETQIAFGCVRVVSDELNRRLPEHLLGLIESGQVPLRRAIREVIRHPGMIPLLFRLGKDTSRAANALAQRLHHLLGTANNRP